MKRVLMTLLVLAISLPWLFAQNLALNMPASASTESQPAANAFDANTGSRWESAFADPQWITVDLGQSYDIGQVILNWEGAYGKEYTIQVSTDSLSWDTVYTETNGDGGIDDLSISGTGRYVKMHGTVRGTPYGYSLWEMEVYEAINPLTDASLSDLAVDGVTVDGFSSTTLTYDVGLPFGTTAVPTVTATTSQIAPAVAVVTNASALPGTATVLVTAQDGNTQLTYSINFTVSLQQMDLPVTFDDPDVEYGTIDFGGNISSFVADPVGGTNQVVQTIKDNAAATWAGTILAVSGSPEVALATPIPFAANAQLLSAMVYAPASGMTVMMKLEDQTNSGIWVETQATTTLANAWDTLVFDFGTPSNGALNLANTYDKVIMFFDFGNTGAADTFYWDNIEFLPADTTTVPVNDSISDYCETYTTHFNIPAEVNSAINLTITNVDATSMMVEIESANTDPVDFLLVTGGSGATISAEDTTVAGKISRTLTWATPPTDVSLNILWSKVSFGGNWMLSQADISVPFIASCGNVAPVLSQIDLPVDFESATVDYTLTDFGGNSSVLGADPANAGNTVAITTKTGGAQTWAGTTMGTSGFASAIPFSATDTKINIDVFSPDTGITVMLKVEDQGNAAIYSEASVSTTVANGWETLEFDYSAGTPALNLSNTYNMASLFFDFGNAGAGDIFYWDNVEMGPTDTTVVTPIDSISDYCETYTTHFNITAEVASAINLTITNVDATSMMVEIESANTDPVDLLLVTGGSGATISDADTTVAGKISRTLTWATPPTDVEMNILWSKVSFGGNWMLSQSNISVPFLASCANFVPPLAQMDLPVTFDDTTINYSFIDFGGAVSQFVADPAGGTNQVVQTEKTVGAQTWAGTSLATVGPPEEGFANAIPFTTMATQMKVRVYAPAVGIPVMLKIEDESNGGIFAEAQDTTTVANAWQTLTFDYAMATGGSFNIANTYDKVSLFYDFGAAGAGDVFYWDDVEFHDTVIVNPSYTIFTDFDMNENELFTGWPNTVEKVANPDASGINMSDSVGCWARGGEQWAHAYSDLSTPVDFSTYPAIEAKVYSPIACQVLCKLESSTGAGPVESFQTVTATNTWQLLSFDFTGVPSLTYDKLIFFFDFASGGADTFYFDDVQLANITLSQIDMPVDFESTSVDYTFTDFGGNSTVLGMDPVVGTNNVAITTKTAGAQTWAGTTIGTATGFASTIPFTAMDTKISVDVYSPAVGITVMLKVEDHTNGGIFSEVSVATTVAMGWETLVFDYAGGAPAIDLANAYDMASIFFDFGNAGVGDMFYWDNVQFVPYVYDPVDLPITFEDPLVDYTFADWGGNVSVLALDPMDSTNHVAQSTKTAGAQTWAGSACVGNADGLASAIPFTPTKTKMSMKVYSPAAGVPILLKVEDKTNAAVSCETLGQTTVANAWETIEFDFANHQTGTPALDTAMTYDKVGVFFDFGNAGAGDIFLWDDVMFIDEVFDVHTLSLVQGWSIISTYIDAFEPLLDSLFAPIISEVVIVKNGTGQVYWPAFGLNLIGDLAIGQGYQINLNSAQTLDVVGTAVVPETTVLNIPMGWSIIGYLRQSPANIETLLSVVVGDVIIVKNGVGSVYWPYWGLNAIGDMNPGEGYQIKTSAAFTYSYPANAAASKSSAVMNQTSYFPKAHNTGNNHTLAIPSGAWEYTPTMGDEIAVFDGSGTVVGAGTYQQGLTAITLWGNDELSNTKDGLTVGEPFTMKMWSKSNGAESTLEVEAWEQGDGNYSVNGISIAQKVSVSESNFSVELFPNPTSDASVVNIQTPAEGSIVLSIFNTMGVKVDELYRGDIASGSYQFNIDLEHYAAGSYFVRLESADKVETKTLQVVK